MHSVCENVDNVPNVKDEGITKTSQLLRVKKLLQYLRTLKPFDLQPGRTFFNMAPAPSNSLKFIDPHKFQQWNLGKKSKLSAEYGQ